MDQKAVGCRHLLRNEWVIDDVDQVSIQILSSNLQKAGVLRALRPLRPPETALRLDGERGIQRTPEAQRENAYRDYTTFHRVTFLSECGFLGLRRDQSIRLSGSEGTGHRRPALSPRPIIRLALPARESCAGRGLRLPRAAPSSCTARSARPRRRTRGDGGAAPSDRW